MSSDEDQEDRLALIQEGRQAVQLAGILGPYIEDQMEIKVRQMAGLYRAGQATPDKLLGLTAEVSCLLGLLSDLNSKARRGDIAANKEMGNAKAN